MSKQKFGSNFKKRAFVGQQSQTTKTIGFGTMSEEDKVSLREKLAANISSISLEASDTNNIEIENIVPDTNYIIASLPRNILKPAPDEWNFFTKPDMQKLIDLATSIYNNGLLQPIIVRKMNPEGSYYQILAGHSRNKAYELLYETLEDPKYLNIEAIVFDYNVINDAQAEDIICDTNFMQRGNLPARDTAKCIYLKAKRLKETQKYGTGSVADKIAEQYKIKRTSVFMWKKLAELIDPLQDLIDVRKISLKNAYKLATLSKDIQQYLVDNYAQLLTDESVRNLSSKDSLEAIINKLEHDYGVTIKSFRYSIPENKLRTPKDIPLLIFVDPKKRMLIEETIKKIDGAYFIDN